MTRSEEMKEYQKGYRAGTRKVVPDVIINSDNLSQRERIFLSVLGSVMAPGTNWQMGEDKVTDMKQYVRLARDFTDEIQRRAGI